MATNPEKLTKYENAEALATDVEKAGKLELAKRIREIEKSSIEHQKVLEKEEIEENTSDWLSELRKGLNEEEETQLREVIDDTETDEYFNEGISEVEKIEIQKQKELSDIIGDGTFSGLVSATLKPLKRDASKLKDKKGVDLLQGADSLFGKIGKIFENLKIGFSYLIWDKFPTIAKWLNLDNPKQEIEDRATAKLAEAKEKAKIETLDKEKRIKEYAKISSKTNGKIFFKIFSASLDIEEKPGFENKDCEKVFEQMIGDTTFLSTPYNSLSDNSTLEKIYSVLKNNDALSQYVEKGTLKEIIKLNLKTFSGGEYKYNKDTFFGFWSKDETKEVNTGRNFLENIYKNDGKKLDEENPTMENLFSKVNFLGDYQKVFEDGIDIEKIKGGTQNLLSKGNTEIAKLSELDFEKLKSGLPNKLRNLKDFQFISQRMMSSGASRNLENGFTLAEGQVSQIPEDNKEIQDFIKELKIFGDEIYDSYFQNSGVIEGLESVEKSDLTLSDIYQIYTITGGKTDFNSLNTIQKTNLIALSMYGFSDSYGVGKKMGDLLGKIKDDASKFKIPEDVKILSTRLAEGIVKATYNGIIAGVKGFLGFATEQPKVAAGLTLVALTGPFFVKRQSIMGMFTGK